LTLLEDRGLVRGAYGRYRPRGALAVVEPVRRNANASALTRTVCPSEVRGASLSASRVPPSAQPARCSGQAPSDQEHSPLLRNLAARRWHCPRSPVTVSEP
jgi:hypothetical protein